MVVLELKVKCPNCGTDTILISKEVNPVIFECQGCNERVVLHNNRVYNVSKEYVKNLLKSHKHQACGQVLTALVSDKAKQMITSDKLEELKKILNDSTPVDVEELIEKLP